MVKWCEKSKKGKANTGLVVKRKNKDVQGIFPLLFFAI
jgi:hypothetical protein